MKNFLSQIAWQLRIALPLIFLLSCSQVQKSVTFEEDRDYQSIAQAAQNWTDLFYRKSGWFGGDGVFAIPLDGREFLPATHSTRTLILFSDSLISFEDFQDSLTNQDYTMIHNSAALLKGREPKKEAIEFYWKKDREGQPESMFSPFEKMTDSPKEYFWLGDGFVNASADSTLYVFAHRVRDIEGGEFFNFEQIGVTLLAIPPGAEPPFEHYRQIETPLFFKTKNNLQATFGGGILVNTAQAGAPNPDGYIYIYATVGFTMEMLAARVLPEHFEDFSAWTFYNGKEWTPDMLSAAPITKGIANEFSMSPLPDGRFALTHQIFGITPEVGIQLAKSPVGPFFPVKTVWQCDEVLEDLDYFTYNAKAFPHLSEPGELLIAYHVNSFDFFTDVLTKTNLYRPRFFTIKL